MLKEKIPCEPRASRARLSPDCFDRTGKLVYYENAAAGMLQQQEIPCGVRKDRTVKTKDANGKRMLPAGTRPPGRVPAALAAMARRIAGNKPTPSEKRAESGKATFFHVQGQSWESKGFVELTPIELERMRSGRPKTADEKRAEQAMKQEEQRQQTEETERIRNYFRAIDGQRREKELRRQQDMEAADVDEEQLAEANRLKVLQHSLNVRYEMDERVREATKAISEAKCSAVWTAQVKERRLLDRAQAECDAHQARKNLEYNNSKWGTDKQKDATDEIKRRQYGADVRQQILDRERMRYTAQDRQQQEAHEMRVAVDEFKKAEAHHVQAVSKGKQSYRQELDNYSKMHREFVRIMCQQDQSDEQRAYDYLLQKEAKLRQELAERKAQQAEVKRQRDALFVVQEKMMNAKDNQDEMRFIAEHERLERKYREAERQAAEKERRIADELRKGNLEQLDRLSQMKACHYTQRERDNRVMMQLRAEEAEQRKVEAAADKVKRNNLRLGVACQMEERERARRLELAAERMEFENARAAELQRQTEIDTVIAVKLDDLTKRGCLPGRELNTLKGRLANVAHKKLGAEMT
ncbi:trichohyalin [Drosophila madeirensis]|uniref:Cilia- and flagella-associated protein 45 n=1 Tax=Drosophila madeirensis TaxID=30013 RepID=A0AAU9FZF4_DROMD